MENFDYKKTILSQFQNAKTLNAILADFAAKIAVGKTEIARQIMDVDYAQGAQLDVLGRDVNCPRRIKKSYSESDDFGYDSGDFYGYDFYGGTYDIKFGEGDYIILNDNAYRLLIKIYALKKILKPTISNLNYMLKILFPARGLAYVTIGQMSVIMRFDFTLETYEKNILLGDYFPIPAGFSKQFIEHKLYSLISHGTEQIDFPADFFSSGNYSKEIIITCTAKGMSSENIASRLWGFDEIGGIPRANLNLGISPQSMYIQTGYGAPQVYGINEHAFNEIKVVFDITNNRQTRYLNGSMIYDYSGGEINRFIYYPYILHFLSSDGGQPISTQILTIEADGAVISDWRAVKQGSVQYSDTPAPSNCMFDLVSGQYKENQGSGNFDIEEITQ